jgi:hypothetical protein
MTHNKVIRPVSSQHEGAVKMTGGRSDQRVSAPVALLRLSSACPSHPTCVPSRRPRGPPPHLITRQDPDCGVAATRTCPAWIRMPGRWVQPPARSTTSRPANWREPWKAYSLHPNVPNHPDLTELSRCLVAACSPRPRTPNRDRSGGGLGHRRDSCRLVAHADHRKCSDVVLAATHAAEGPLLASRDGPRPSPGQGSALGT